MTDEYEEEPGEYRWSPGPEVDEAARAISDLYSFAPGGGSLHIVTDDGNIEDHYIDWCLEHVWEFGSDAPEERAQEIYTGLLLRELTEDERWTAIEKEFRQHRAR